VKDELKICSSCDWSGPENWLDDSKCPWCGAEVEDYTPGPKIEYRPTNIDES